MKLLARWKLLSHQWLIAIDQFVYVTVGGWIYLATGGNCPNAQETISSRVGRAAVAGKRWGLILEWFIDHLFEWIAGTPLGHCRRSIEPQFLPADEV
jgi:hypothetical protein